MKLNPPASSSDIEAAREIARRLHQRRRRADFARSGDALPPLEPAARTPPAFAPAPPRVAGPKPAPPLAAAPVSPERALRDEPAPPSWDDTEDDEPATIEEHLTGALDDLTGEPAEAEPEGPEEALAGAASPDVTIDVEDASVSPDEMVGSPERSVGSPDESGEEGLFEEPLGGDDFEPPSPPGAVEPVPALGAAEELFDEPAPPPSWDDVVETCREIAGASGAMIIDPAGQVFAARGEWPDPGPDAIAGRLVAMMERTLKDAPTRSVSAPVGGQHLTAWRVPLTEGLVTAAFIADKPLRSEVRTAIDAEIHRGAGA